MQDPERRTSTHNSLEFQVECETNYGEEVRICGNSMELGNWNPLLGHRLVTDAKSYPFWKSLIPLIIKNNNKIEYKACIISNNRVTWQRNVANRQIQCFHPTSIKFTFNEPNQKLKQRLVTEIVCKQGTLDILQQMQQSETSSIQFKSNYPIEKYFQHQENDDLGISRGFSNSDLSSNLFSPGQQFRSGSGEFDQFFGQDSLELDNKHLTPQPLRLQSRRTQIYTRSNDYRQLFSTQALEQPRSDRSRSRSGQKSQSGNQKNSQQPMSPFIIHVPSIDNKAQKNKQDSSKPSTKKTCESNQIDNDEYSRQNQEYNQNQSDDKSTSTVMECDTEYLTTRDNDVVIEKPVPSYEDV